MNDNAPSHSLDSTTDESSNDSMAYQHFIEPFVIRSDIANITYYEVLPMFENNKSSHFFLIFILLFIKGLSVNILIFLTFLNHIYFFVCKHADFSHILDCVFFLYLIIANKNG